MRFLADECCAASLVAGLRQDGHSVVYVGEEFTGLSDDEVLDHALKERRLVGRVAQGNFTPRRSRNRT